MQNINGDSDILILSNNHVLADENRGKGDDPIVQPCIADGGLVAEDVVAKLHHSTPLTPRKVNLFDCALAKLADGIPFDPRDLAKLGKLRGTRQEPPEIGASVGKVGRTTGSTRGIITAIEMDSLLVDYRLGTLRFDNQFEIESLDSAPFSQAGDSGSLVVDSENLGAGLLFAGSETGGHSDQGLTYAHPLGELLKFLKVQVLH
ncbi:hypothetical protein [Paludibaculum fermentans]|uniref:hypothetical protein n=1 Tax=Paludibaculum fermentans TaxID=1473598 RepID=UPI003EB85B5D